MSDKDLPQSIGENTPEPIPFPNQEELCKRLDEFYISAGIKRDIQPSSFFRGALYAMRHEYRKDNPDWIAQVAHSLREILYTFERGGGKRSTAFEQYGSTYDARKRDGDVGQYYNLIRSLAHHNFIDAGKSALIGGNESNIVKITGDIFEDIIFQFGKILFAVLRRQINAHAEIDEILKQDPQKIRRENLEELVTINFDARQYFYTKADERWLDWLWENGFLDVIKEKSEDTIRHGYRTPELDYLEKIAEQTPAKVTDIMLSIPVSVEHFNPEVVDRFLWICGKLPADQTVRMTQKIKNEQWPKLMGKLNHWGFEYEKMFKTLLEAKDYNNIIILAEALLAVRPKEDIIKSNSGFIEDNPFYFGELSYTKALHYLTSVDDEHKESALAVASNALKNVVLNTEREKSCGVFAVEDSFFLYDVDFFTLKIDDEDHFSSRDNVRSLAATVKILATDLIKNCNEAENIQRLYKTYIEMLPDSRSMWRLKLVIISLCPGVFKEELKQMFFRLFDKDSYYDLISGPEYEKTLRAGFTVLSEDDKREYVRQVIAYFSKRAQADSEGQKYHKRHGWEILSSIGQLTEEEKAQCEQAFGQKCDPMFEPEPSFSGIKSGFISPKGPVTPEEFNKIAVHDIADKLRNEWAPETLSKQNKSDDFLNPLNAEGVSNILRIDIPKRFKDYIDSAGLFFERDVLDQHYTYSFLQGIQKAIHDDRTSKENLDYGNLISLLLDIIKSGKKNPFGRKTRDRETFDAWLSDWESVHSAIGDIVQELLNEHDSKIIIDFQQFRSEFIDVITYLLNYPDPTPADEKIETAKISTKDPDSNEYIVTDPFSIAVNSVRGRAFQALVLFIYQDGKQFAKEAGVKIANDIKQLYEQILAREDTQALMFMFGHYLPSFYFRDVDWMISLLSKIFPTAMDKKDLYLAAWEGYLANNLYKEIFFNVDIQKLYERGVKLKTSEYTKRKYFREPDEGIATHFALAFMHYEEFGFEHPFFKAFWASNNIESHSAFISFVGRSFVSGNNIKADELLKAESGSKQRLYDFWDWMLEHYTNPKPFTEFGYWVNVEKGIFNNAWLAEHLRKTMERTNGEIDWEYGLTKSIKVLAEASPSDTLIILRLLFLEGGVRLKKMRMPFSLRDGWVDAFKILYSNEDTKTGAYTLVDDLIREGGSIFWSLKKVIE